MKNKLKTYYWITIALILISSFAGCQSNSENDQKLNNSFQKSISARQAAIEGLFNLNNMKSSSAVKNLPDIKLADTTYFGNSNEGLISDSINVIYLDINKLLEHDGNLEINEALISGEEIIFSAKSNTDVNTGIVVKKVQEEWKFTGLLHTDFSKTIDSLNNSNTKSKQNNDHQGYLLKIPQLYLAFIAKEIKDDYLLTSLTSNIRFNIKKNDQIQASELFQEISKRLKEKDTEFLTPETFMPRKKE